MTPRPSHQLNAGFTLIEVLLALSIFAVVATTVSLSMSNASLSAAALEKRTIGRWVMENEINTIKIEGFSSAGERTFEREMGGYEWLVKVSGKVADSALPSVLILDVTVYLKEGTGFDNEVFIDGLQTYVLTGGSL